MENKILGGLKPLASSYLYVYVIAALPSIRENILVHGDNTRVVEGWWKHRHYNKVVNRVFQRIQEFLHHLPNRLGIVTTYVPSEFNPANDLSRGILRPSHLLLHPSIFPSNLVLLLLMQLSHCPPPSYGYCMIGNTLFLQLNSSTAPSPSNKLQNKASQHGQKRKISSMTHSSTTLNDFKKHTHFGTPLFKHPVPTLIPQTYR
jgi:hypothetical protein